MRYDHVVALKLEARLELQSMIPRAVLFDLDNTLVHRAQSITSYAHKFVADFNDRLDQVSESLVSTTILQQDNGGYLAANSAFKSIQDAVSYTLSSRLAWRTPATPEEIQVHWTRHFPSHAIAMSGASQLVNFLSGCNIRIGIISNGSQRSRLETVNALPFRNKIETLVSSEKIGVKKPDPHIFKVTATELGVDTKECWYVGDHPINDVSGALHAGMHAIWLRGFHDWPIDERQPDVSVSSLSEVIHLITQDDPHTL